MSRKSLEEILMRRDGVTREEAKEQIEDCLEDLENGNWSAIQDNLDLEDDYIFDVMGW